MNKNCFLIIRYKLVMDITVNPSITVLIRVLMTSVILVNSVDDRCC